MNDYISLEPGDSLSRTLPLFKNDDYIFIVDEDGMYRGLLRKKDLIRTKLPLRTKVGTLLRHAPKIFPDDAQQDIAHLMFESGLYQLPVMDDGKLLGVVKSDQLIRQLADTKIGKLPIGNLMSAPVITIRPKKPISKAIALFNKAEISRLPVTGSGDVLGILTLYDIIDHVLHPENKPNGWGAHGTYIGEKKDYLRMPVRGLMRRVPALFPSDFETKDVINRILEMNLRGMLIGENGKLEGIVTKRDLLEPLAGYEQEEPIFVQFAGELDALSGFDKVAARADIIETFRKHIEFLDSAQVFVHLKQHDETKRDVHQVHCNIRLSSPKGMFIATDQGWGFDHAIKKAAQAMERQIRKEKKK